MLRRRLDSLRVLTHQPVLRPPTRRSSCEPTTAYYSNFPTLYVIADSKTHLVLAVYPKRGPTPDVSELVKFYTKLAPGIDLQTLYADAGYDSEPNHVFMRDDLNIHSLIPPRIGRPTTKPAKGKYRRLMQRLFADTQAINYGQRWQVETTFSMIKRNLGHAISAKTYHAQSREMLLNCITHNAMILWRRYRGFLPSTLDFVYKKCEPCPELSGVIHR